MPNYSSEAYFLFDCPPHPETFTFRLTNPSKIEQARKILSKEEKKMHVSGIIVKGPCPYKRRMQRIPAQRYLSLDF